MAKRKPDREARLLDEFTQRYKVGKAITGLTNEEVGSLIGLSHTALKRRRDKPGSFTLRELIVIGTAFRWTEEDYQAIINAGI